MELRHLRYFVAVAEELHFGHAAVRLAMTQPPLSQQIRQLEEELQVTLFRRRTRRRVELTEAGVSFLAGARRALAEVERAVTAAQRTARGEEGNLVVGFVGTAAYAFLPELLQHLRVGYPDITLSLREMTTAQQVEALAGGDVDLGFLRPPHMGKDIVTETLWEEQLVAVLPDHHPQAGPIEVPLDVKDLAEEPFVLFPPREGHGLYSQVMECCRTAGFQPRAIQEAVQMETLLSLVAGNIGVTLAPAAVRTLGRDGVVCRPLTSSPTLALATAWRAGDERVVLHRVLEVTRQFARSSRH
jgi:DNA-binding transcriptional LysR family regulator